MEGKLIKNNGKWFVDYISEPAGDNNWHELLPVYQTEFDTEIVADLKLVELFNKPVNELDGLNVEFEIRVRTIFEYTVEYAKLRNNMGINEFRKKESNKNKRDAELDKLLKDESNQYCYILKDGMFYRPNYSGYTYNITEAGVYSIADGVDCAKRCDELHLRVTNPEKHNALIEKEIEILKSRLIK